MRVAELNGALLDYWVARAQGYEHTSARDAGFALDGQAAPCIFTTSRGNLRLAKADSVTAWNPSTAWVCGGPIIEREGISIMRWEIPNDNGANWTARNLRADIHADGPTPLIAAMRAFVASKFGEEVEDAPQERAG